MAHIGIVVGTPRLGGYIWTLVASSIRTEAARRQFRLTSLASRTAAEQAAGLDALIAQRVDVLVMKTLMTTDDGQLFRLLDKVHAAGIPLVTLDSAIDHPAVVCTVGADNRKSQALVTEHIFERLNHRGKVIFLRADPRPASGAARNASFVEVLGRYPGIELVHEATIDWSTPVSRRTQGAEAIRAALASVPHIDAIVATNDEAALGAISALEEAGRPLPLVSGFDGLSEGLLAVRDRKLAATIRQAPIAMARATLDVAEALMRGAPVGRRAEVATELVTADNAVGTALDALKLVPALIQDLTENHEQQRELQQETIAKQSRVLQTVVAVSNVVGQIRDPRRMTQAFVALVREQFTLRDAVIYTRIAAAAGDDGMDIASSGRADSEVDEAAELSPAERALFADVMQSHRTRLMGEPADGSPDSSASAPWRSRLLIPLRTAELAAGVLDLQSDKPNAFDHDTVQVLEAIAHQISTALDNAKLHAETVRLAESELQQSQAKAALAEHAQYLSNHDSLTDLPNRRLFHELLEKAISQARRAQTQLAVLFLDLDRFKSINDTLGHEAGDALLKEVAARLKTCLRDSDTVARLGGDEYVVLLQQLPEDQAPATVARKIIHAVAEPFTLIGHEFRITVSVGIALYPDDGLDEQALTQHADIAMYHAKKQGKNNFQFYSERLNTHSIERLSLEAGLRRALQHGEFRLHYQAKRDMQSGQVSGMEVLLRWQHPELGLVAPLQFLSVAEETGLMVPIGHWVIKTACEQNVAWQQQGLPPLVVSVNLTTRQFADDRLLVDIQAILAATGMDARWLEFEITERTLIRDTDRTLRVLSQLKDAGIRVAIDDFGTGYSSLATLRQFPLDTIKIDRSFVSGVGGGENLELAQAIIAMGRSLSLNVVAQGVETLQQANLLRSHACDEFQGFYFNTPVPAEGFATLLQSEMRGRQTAPHEPGEPAEPQGSDQIRDGDPSSART